MPLALTSEISHQNYLLKKNTHLVWWETLKKKTEFSEPKKKKTARFVKKEKENSFRKQLAAEKTFRDDYCVYTFGFYNPDLKLGRWLCTADRSVFSRVRVRAQLLLQADGFSFFLTSFPPKL